MPSAPKPETADRFQSIELGPQIETKVKASRFLAQGYPIRHLKDVAAILQDCRKVHHTANHHCWGFRGDPTLGHSDDDGEPRNTAGPPILAAIDKVGVQRCLVVVVRYFGGTKLGTGGMIKAYGEAALACLEETPRVWVWREAQVHLTCAYDDVGIVEAILAREAASLRGVERNFASIAAFVITTPASWANNLADILGDATAGRSQIVVKSLNS